MDDARDGKKGMQIGDVARKAGISARAVRYYEELGLIRPSSHSQGGFRLYGDESFKRLQLINHLKELGLTLTEIGEILSVKGRKGSDRETAQRLLGLFDDKLALLEAKIRVLEIMKAEIQGTLRLLRRCAQCRNEVLMDAILCRRCSMLAEMERIPDTFQVLLQNLEPQP
jgi:MerR family copper efflux transcriptional regulator